MKNHENCSFWIYVDEDETKIESFDKLHELIEICYNNKLDYSKYAEGQIHLGDGECTALSDDDFISFYDLTSITDYHLARYEGGTLFDHQK